MFIRQGLACLQPDIVDFSLLAPFAPFRGRDAFSTRAALSQRDVDPIRESGRPRPARSLLPLSSPFKRDSLTRGSFYLQKRRCGKPNCRCARGFIDGKNIGRCKQQWGIDMLISMKRNLDIWEDAWALGQREPRQIVPVTAPVPKSSVGKQPEHIARAEAKRQRTLAARRLAPDPAQTLSQHEYCWLKGFRSWSDLPVPIHVLLMRDRYVDRQAQEWALMSTRDYVQMQQPREDYGLRTKIEERHRTAPVAVMASACPAVGQSQSTP
jgi:hypothetical protein